MITVSNSFKNAIKNANREIHGYVEVEYQNKDFDTTVTQIPTKSDIVVENGLIKGEKTMQKYATLENNYTLLDGSFMVWNENVLLSSGYISNDVFGNINNSTIIITNNSTDLSTKGITIYFKENLPFDFVVTLTDTDDNEIVNVVSNNQSYVYQYLFYEEKNIKTVKIEISRMEKPLNRLRIAYIDFNISYLYEGNELINFDVTEELDLLLENIPINNCDIKINNYPDTYGRSKFDIINPQGITQYLNDNVIIKPYIGVLTDVNGIEYVPMGTFYLNNWSSDSDGNVTFNGYSIFNKFKGRQMIVNTDFLFDPIYARDIGDMIKNQIDVNIDFPLYSFPWTNEYLKNTDLFDYISHVMPSFLYYNTYNNTVSEFRKFYVDRYGVITLNRLNNTIVDKIDRNMLVTDLNYKVQNKIKYLNIKSTYPKLGSTVSNILNENYTLKNDEEYVWFVNDDYDIGDISSFNYSVISGSAVATMIGYGRSLILVKITGTINSMINITCNGNAYVVTNTINKNISMINNIESGDNLDIDLSGYYYVLNPDILKTIYFTLPKKYKITAQTMGDPSLEIGDTISVQSRYSDVNNGYKSFVITKQQFTFNGGLQCVLEGVGD